MLVLLLSAAPCCQRYFYSYTELSIVGYGQAVSPYLQADLDTDTVYPYVPAELVDSLIQKHGGFYKIETV